MMIEKKLVLSFIEFLKDKISKEQSQDVIEGLEVAIQCLENSFFVNSKDFNEFKNTPHKTLVDIFKENISKDKLVDINEKQKAEEFKNQGNEFMKVDNINSALENYNKAIEIDESDPIYYCNRAAAYLKMNKIDDAIVDCEKALQLNPNYSKAYGRLGLAYISAERFKEAETAYKKALSIEPNNESYINNLKIVDEKLIECGQKTEDTNTTSDPPRSDIGNIFGNMFGGSNASGGGQLDFSALLNNPSLINMATNLMSNPNIQTALSGILNTSQAAPEAGDAGPNNLNSFLNIGQQLASQIQNQNPELISQLRNQFMNVNSTNPAGTETTNNSNKPDGNEKK